VSARSVRARVERDGSEVRLQVSAAKTRCKTVDRRGSFSASEPAGPAFRNYIFRSSILESTMWPQAPWSGFTVFLGESLDPFRRETFANELLDPVAR
jgi:hypothetical protein